MNIRSLKIINILSKKQEYINLISIYDIINNYTRQNPNTIKRSSMHCLKHWHYPKSKNRSIIIKSSFMQLINKYIQKRYIKKRKKSKWLRDKENTHAKRKSRVKGGKFFFTFHISWKKKFMTWRCTSAVIESWRWRVRSRHPHPLKKKKKKKKGKKEKEKSKRKC